MSLKEEDWPSLDKTSVNRRNCFSNVVPKQGNTDIDQAGPAAGIAQKSSSSGPKIVAHSVGDFQTTNTPGSSVPDPVRMYFERYPNFVYDPSVPPARLFDRLVQQNRWSIGSSKFQVALSQIQAVLFRQFDLSVEVPGPDIVEPEPEPEPEPGLTKSAPAAEDGSSSRAGATKISKGAKRRMKKARSQAMADGNGLAQDANGSTTPVISGEDLDKAKAEEMKLSSPSSAPGDTQSVSSPKPQITKDANFVPIVPPEESQTRLDPKPVNVSANPKRFRGSTSTIRTSGFGKNTAYYTGTVTVVSVPGRTPDVTTGHEVSPGGTNPPSSSPGNGNNIFQQLNEQPTISCPEDQSSPLDVFFSEYPDFDSERNRTLSVATQLRQLRERERWWGRRFALWNAAFQKYRQALVLQFNASYGTDADDLATWHRILMVMGAGTPGTVDECKSLVGSMYVNLVDLVDASLDPVSIPVVSVFESAEALRLYTIRTQKYFPKDHALAGGLLNHFLRVIF